MRVKAYTIWKILRAAEELVHEASRMIGAERAFCTWGVSPVRHGAAPALAAIEMSESRMLPLRD
jgi:hypothetical protein